MNQTNNGVLQFIVFCSSHHSTITILLIPPLCRPYIVLHLSPLHRYCPCNTWDTLKDPTPSFELTSLALMAVRHINAETGSADIRKSCQPLHLLRVTSFARSQDAAMLSIEFEALAGASLDANMAKIYTAESLFPTRSARDDRVLEHGKELFVVEFQATTSKPEPGQAKETGKAAGAGKTGEGCGTKRACPHEPLMQHGVTDFQVGANHDAESGEFNTVGGILQEAGETRVFERMDSRPSTEEYTVRFTSTGGGETDGGGGGGKTGKNKEWQSWKVSMKQGNAWYANTWTRSDKAPLGHHTASITRTTGGIAGDNAPFGAYSFVVIPEPSASNGGGKTTVFGQTDSALDDLTRMYKISSVSRLSHYIKDEPCTPPGVNKNFCVCDGPWISDAKRTDVSKLKNMNR